MDTLCAQCEDGVGKGYEVFYLKAGVDELREEEMIRQVRSVIGPDMKIRIIIEQKFLFHLCTLKHD